MCYVTLRCYRDCSFYGQVGRAAGIWRSGSRSAPQCCFRQVFLVRVTTRTSVFVTRRRETRHAMMNGYVDHASMPYSDLSLIGCPCTTGFVPLVMYLPHRHSQTYTCAICEGSPPRQCVLPCRFHTGTDHHHSVKEPSRTVNSPQIGSLAFLKAERMALKKKKKKIQRDAARRLESIHHSARNRSLSLKALHGVFPLSSKGPQHSLQSNELK